MQMLLMQVLLDCNSLIILQLMVLSLSSNRIRCKISNSLISWSYKRGKSLNRNIGIFVSRIGNIKRSNRSSSFPISSFTPISNTFNFNIKFYFLLPFNITTISLNISLNIILILIFNISLILIFNINSNISLY